MNGWLTRYRGYITLSLLFLIALGAVFFLSRRADPKPVQLSTPAPRPTPTLRPSATPAGIIIEVSGAVVNPGLFHLADGARVDDAIRAAGGASTEADLARLNLARRLSDGEMLVVPKVGEPTAAATAAPAGRTAQATRTPTPTPALSVNINTANAQALDPLPGIGPALAQRIVDYREAHGPFKTIEDIMQVKGIGPAEFAAIKDKIVVQ